MSLFKANYRYNSVTSLMPRQAKKRSKNAKKRVKKLITLYKELYKTAKLVQRRIKLYYNRKRFKRPDLKEGNKV